MCLRGKGRRRRRRKSELTLTVFPGDPFPGTADLRFHFRLRVFARTHVRSICMQPVQGAGCRADNKRGCYPLGSRGYNSSPIPETKEEKSRFSRSLRLLAPFFPSWQCRFNMAPFYHTFLLPATRRRHHRFCGLSRINKCRWKFISPGVNFFFFFTSLSWRVRSKASGYRC